MPDFRIQTVKVGKQTFLFYLEYANSWAHFAIANPKIFVINQQIHKSLQKIAQLCPRSQNSPRRGF